MNQAATSTILFSLDVEPKDAPVGATTGATSLLRGWVVRAGAPVELLLQLDGRELKRLRPGCIRHDVYSRFPDSVFGIVSGFELVFPLEALQMLAPERLRLVARSAGAERVVWQWRGALMPGDQIAAEKALRSWAVGLVGSVEVVAESGAGPDPAIEVTLVLESSAATPDVPALLSRLDQLTGILSRRFSVRGAHAVLQDAGLQHAGFQHAGEHGSAGLSAADPRLGDQRSFTVTSLFTDRNPASHVLVLLQDEAALGYLDLEALVDDLIRLSPMGVLSAALFGGTSGVAGPPGISLGAFRARTSVSGASMPLLGQSRALAGAVVLREDWLRERLAALGVASSRDAGRGALLSSLLRRATGAFPVDLRQPVLLGETEPGYEESERRQLQHSLDRLLQVEAGWMPGDDAFVLLLPERWSELAAAELRQVVLLGEALGAEGKRVLLAVDQPNFRRTYLGELPVVGIDDLTSGRVPLGGSWLIACAWDSVRSAHALRYLHRVKVLLLLPDFTREAYESHGREHLETLTWAIKGAELCLVQNPRILRALKEDGVGEERLFHLPYFSGHAPAPLREGIREGVLFVVGTATGASSRVLLRALKAFSSIEPSVPFTVAGPKLPSWGSELLALGAKTVFGAPIADVLDSFSSYKVVVDCSGAGSESATLFEARRRGALGVSAALFEGRGEPGDVELRDPKAFALRIRSMLGTHSSASPGNSGGLASEGVSGEAVSAGSDPSNSNAAGTMPADLSARVTARYAESVRRLESERAERRAASIVIPVYCALDATLQCLTSVLQHAPRDWEIIVVNDVSDYGTTVALREAADRHPRIRLIERPANGGFVQACLDGLAAASPQNDLVLLNSDLVVTEGALESLQQAAYCRYNTALSSVLSTNSPHLQIDVNVADSLHRAAERLRQLSNREYPTVITPEGQLLYVRRWALERFGFFDPAYNRGFYEESDLSMRVYLNGGDMVVADDALVFHRKSASFGLEGGLLEKQKNRPVFEARWGRYYWMMYPEFLRRNPLQELRERYRALAIPISPPQAPVPVTNLPRLLSRIAGESTEARRIQGRSPHGALDGVSVVFIVPSVILGGGTLSVLQHVNELQLRGIEARVLSLSVPEATSFPYLVPPIPVSIEELSELGWTNQKVVATFWLTAYLVKALTHRFPGLEGYYYIQDYEPWFYSLPERYPTVREAEQSYELGLRPVVKTTFLRDLVEQKHAVTPEVITPGLARSVFYEGRQDLHLGRPRLTAYFRPRTPRRGGKEALAVLKEVKRRVPEAELRIFGEESELPPELVGVVEPRGRLSQEQVAKLYRETDIVLDLSYWHGFGRMGIEGMASGAVPVLSDSGGVRAYTEDGYNGFLVSHAELEEAVERIVLLMKDRDLRLTMRRRGLETVKRFSEQKAVDDWCELFGIESTRLSLRAETVDAKQPERLQLVKP